MNNGYIAILIWNVLVFLLYGIDKMLARGDTRRISEKTLILCAFLFGAFGAASGMAFFHHKTRKIKFKILIPLFCIINSVVLGFLSTGKIEF